MKFEGTQVNIPIKGIMRAGTDNVCADGAMNEVVGMEYKDGSWLPYQYSIEGVYVRKLVVNDNVESLVGLSHISKVYIHKTSDNGSHYVFVDNNGVVYYEYERTATQTTLTINTKELASGYKDIAFVGNVLCVATDEGIKYFMWEGSAYGAYTSDNRALLQFRVTEGIYRDEAEENIVGMSYVERIKSAEYGSERDSYENRKSVIGGITAARGAARDLGGLTGYFFVCYAYRLKNGELIQASAPVLMSRPNTEYTTENQTYHKNVYGEHNPFPGPPYFPRQGSTTQIDRNDFLFVPEDSGNFDVVALAKGPGVTHTQDYVIFVPPKNGEYWYGSEQDEEERNSKEGELRIVSIEENVSDPVGQVTRKKYIHKTENGQILAAYKDGSWVYGSDGSDPQWEPEWSNSGEMTDGLPFASVPNCLCSMVKCMLNNGQGGSSKQNYIYTSMVAANKLQYRITNKTSYNKDLIDSVCIFISPEVFPFCMPDNIEDFESNFYDEVTKRVVKNKVHDAYICNTYVTSYMPLYKSEEDIAKELRSIKGLYLIKEIPFEELEIGQNWIDIDLEGLLGDNLLVREQLPLSAFNYTETKPELLKAYNYRLHMYDYVQKLFSGYALPEFTIDGGVGQKIVDLVSREGSAIPDYVEISVVINDVQGERKTVKYTEGWSDNYSTYLSPVLIYPDEDAVSMTIRLYWDGQDEVWTEKTFPLKPMVGMGLACYVHPRLECITFDEPTETGYPDPEDRPLDTPENDIVDTHNGIKVSDVAYPTYFPDKYTYRIGNERIIGTGLLTLPMTQDNFGRNSLILFCTDGIYSLRTDSSGNGVYTNTDYVAPDVCVNPNSICEIGGAIFFASDKGLMMLTGDTNGNVVLYAPHLNGMPRFLPATAESKEAHGVYKKMINSEAILSKVSVGDFNSAISDNDFADFIKNNGTHLVYISIKNKLLAYNNSYGYSYFIDIPTGNTTKLQLTSICDDGSVIDKGLWQGNGEQGGNYGVYTLGYVSEEANAISCLIQTRPIKVQQDDKCSYRVVLTGYFEGLEGNWAELIVLGSLDGDHWRTIGLKEKKLVGGFHNLGALTERGSWKYLMFIFGGKLSEKSHIDSVDITVEGRYNNKKR